MTSPREILVDLFSDVTTMVNEGSADEAADEVIHELKRYGFLIVSNTPCLIPTATTPPPLPHSKTEE